MSILKREILFPGKTTLGSVEPESKLLYHFKTAIIQKEGGEPVEVDDSRRLSAGKPVETIYGKQFKLPIWESCLTSMLRGEICQLTVRDDPQTHLINMNYVVTSKCFRKYYGMKPTVGKNHDHAGHSHDDSEDPFRHTASHHCSMSIQNSPYADLNGMIQKPPEIFVFTFELVDVIPPQNYSKDLWQMSDEEKLSMLPIFRQDGNKNFKAGHYDAASVAYSKGLTILESLMLKEKPGDVDYLNLEQMMIPLLLNLAQVKLDQHEYYECIKHANEVLKRDPNNIKAIFRRAKAHMNVWDFDEARRGFNRCLEMDQSMSKLVSECLEHLKFKEASGNQKDSKMYKTLFQNLKEQPQ